MTKMAILVDGGFFIKRYHSIFKGANDYIQYDVTQTIKVFMKLMNYHYNKQGVELYRILFYDCPPLEKRVMNPVTGRNINYAVSDVFKYRMGFFEELKCQRKVALRLGILNDNGGWQIKSSLTKDLIKKTKKIDDLNENDVTYMVQQKGVDMKIGLDIASLAYKRLVDRIVLIAGDSDFVPAAKVARREGIDFILDPMRNPISPSLNEHIDGLKTTSPTHGCKNIAMFLGNGKKKRTK